MFIENKSITSKKGEEFDLLVTRAREYEIGNDGNASSTYVSSTKNKTKVTKEKLNLLGM